LQSVKTSYLYISHLVQGRLLLGGSARVPI
jgi:hypothetical protein